MPRVHAGYSAKVFQLGASGWLTWTHEQSQKARKIIIMLTSLYLLEFSKFSSLSNHVLNKIKLENYFSELGKYPSSGDIATMNHNWTKYPRHFYTCKNANHSHTSDPSLTSKNLFSPFWVHRNSQNSMESRLVTLHNNISFSLPIMFIYIPSQVLTRPGDNF